MEAMSLYGRSADDRICRDAAIAAIAAEVEVGSGEDRQVLADALDFVAGEEHDATRRAFVEELRGRLPGDGATEEEEDRTRRSNAGHFDLDGRLQVTDLKARMRRRARDSKHLNRWYADFHRQFLDAEWRFYESLFREVDGEINWNWKRAFVVKGLGDEIWLLYEVWEEDDDKVPALVTRLLHAAQAATGDLIRWVSATEEDAGEEWDKWDQDDGEPWEMKNLPLKFYVDIIDDAFEITGPRQDFITGRLPRILGEEDAWAGKDFVELGNRLHAGGLLGDGRRLVTTIRTDYIGWEVDRFFRMTKYALPCVVAVGRNLFEEAVQGSPKDADRVGDTELRKAVFACSIRDSRGTRFDHRFRFVKKDVDARCLKGVGEGYAVYQVIREHELLGLRHTSADDEVMEDTYKVFTEEMEDAARAALHARTQ